MQTVSVRTLALMVELLIAVAAQQYLSSAKSVKPDAVWLASAGTTAQPASADGTGCPAER